MLAEATGTSLGTWVEIPGDKTFLHYQNQGPGQITALVLNVLPGKWEVQQYKAQGNNPFYVCINCKGDYKDFLQRIFNDHVPEVEGVKVHSLFKKGEVIFSIWSSPEQQKSRHYINNVLNTLCNREVMQYNCVPIVIKDIFQRKINELKMPVREEEVFNEEEDWCLDISAVGLMSQTSGTVQEDEEEEYVDPFDVPDSE